jgi:phosphoribosyl 1,2-cyclic phosphodiesterase
MSRRLARLKAEAAELCAILLTHEHRDHAAGVGVLARRFGLPVWMTAGTFSAVSPVLGRLPSVRFFQPSIRFEIGDIELYPFPVPHDAREPCQFVFSDGQRRLGFLTDVGEATKDIEHRLRGCNALVLECNHDGEMLRHGPYPPFLKARIAGGLGHLNNETSAGLLARLRHPALQGVVGAHLSETNNRPGLVRTALSRALGCEPGWIDVAGQDRGLGWRALAPGWV